MQRFGNGVRRDGVIHQNLERLAGFNRFVNIPNVQCETHIGPRMRGQPVQSFPTDFFMMQGQITGDPDFDLLRITAGSAFGMPSPGHTTLTRQPGGGWAVDSFFDITYRIDFVGAPGGPLAGHSGSTTGTIRMATGGPFTQACCLPSGCQDLSPGTCTALCGIPQGPGTNCQNVFCAFPDCGATCDGTGFPVDCSRLCSRRLG